MLEIHPHVPLLGTLGLGIALFSYDGAVSWGFSADWDLVPDLHDLVLATERSFAESARRRDRGEATRARPAGPLSDGPPECRQSQAPGSADPEAATAAASKATQCSVETHGIPLKPPSRPEMACAISILKKEGTKMAEYRMKVAPDRWLHNGRRPKAGGGFAVPGSRPNSGAIEDLQRRPLGGQAKGRRIFVYRIGYRLAGET